MHRYAFLALLLAVAACDSSSDLTRLDVSTLSHDPAALIGTWDLVSVTSSGQTGAPITTPVTKGQESYAFNEDGTARISHSYGAVGTSWEVAWEVRRREGLADVPPSLYLGDQPIYFGIDGDRLYFDSRPVDGSLEEYRRR